MISPSVVGVGGEADIPELWERRSELNGHEGTLGVHHRRADDVGFHLFLGLGILNGNFGAGGQALGQDDHRPAGADGVRGAVNGIGFAFEVHENGHPKEHTLSAAALFIGLRTNRVGAALDVRGSGGTECGRRRFWHGRHSSNPQKSISGATSSMPYSQPSGC